MAETWVWSSHILTTVHGFYHHASWSLGGARPVRRLDDIYMYCFANDVLMTCGVWHIQVYIARQREHVLLLSTLRRDQCISYAKKAEGIQVLLPLELCSGGNTIYPVGYIS